MKKKFSAAAVIFTLLLSGCGSDGDLYAPREKNELLDPKETEPASAATDETETETSDIDSILMQTHT